MISNFLPFRNTGVIRVKLSARHSPHGQKNILRTARLTLSTNFLNGCYKFMYCHSILGLFFLFITMCSWAQAPTYHYLFDQESRKPIEDAFVFIDKGEINSISNHDGQFSLPGLIAPTASVYLSHINYGLQQVDFAQLQNFDTLFLKHNTLALPQIQVSANSNKKRKRWLKKFNRAFLGEDYKQNKTYILNENGLLFTQSKGNLEATSNVLLEIVNENLGYKIYYWLESFKRSPDGIVNYHGKYFFESFPAVSDVMLAERQSTYTNTTEHFLKSIILGNHKSYYAIRIAKLNDAGSLVNHGKANLKNILSYDETTNLYQLDIPDFLEIEHLGLKAISFKSEVSGVSGVGHQVDQELLKEGMSKNNSVATHKTSLLFSKIDKLIFDKNGTIVNSEYIQRYGYWSTQGMSNVLPSSFEQHQVDTIRAAKSEVNDQELLVRLLWNATSAQYEHIFNELSANWSNSLISPLADIMSISNNTVLVSEINQFLERQTLVKPGHHGLDWLAWAWESNTNLPAWYAAFKADLYQAIDRKFHDYFSNRETLSAIRIDEAVWGGVKQDGIPPLRFPSLLNISDASYLSDDDIIFGVIHNNVARAYPQRVLGWHEMVIDQFGRDTLTCVYCTLCGTMIAYNNQSNIGNHTFGTSGFLYRSNKLMYDQETQSLWSTIRGKPVVGPLINKNIELQEIPVVTTTWEDWKSQHPESKVLSINTGFHRNYAEGEAYKNYFSHDDLMFPVPISDTRLRNKALVFVIRNLDAIQPTAFEKNYLIENKIVQHTIGDRNIVIVSNKTGKIMAFDSGHYLFTMKNGNLVDQFDESWSLLDQQLRHFSNNNTLARLDGHEIFWFAWVNTFPQTILIN